MSDLSVLSEQELRSRLWKNLSTIEQMKHEASERGYSSIGEDYFGSELVEENKEIYKILSERASLYADKVSVILDVVPDAFDIYWRLLEDYSLSLSTILK